MRSRPEFHTHTGQTGKLTVEQMHHAAARYHLGKTKSGLPIFWMIDDMWDPLDARIGDDSWMSTLLKAREPLLSCWHPRHCLFGLHLLYSGSSATRNLPKSFPAVGCNPTISIVESEASAVVLSELFPESIWMAYVSAAFLSIDFFEPLMGCMVTIYPRTDPYMSNYLYFDELAAEVRKRYDIRITVDALLEDHATDDQKSRCIDLLDFLFAAL